MTRKLAGPVLCEGWLSCCGRGLAHFDTTPGPQEDMGSVGKGLCCALCFPQLGASLEWRNARKRAGKGTGTSRFVGLEPVDKSVGELENNGVKILLMAALQGCPLSWPPILQMGKLTPSR